MWRKKHREEDPEAPPGKRLRDNIVDLYGSGDIPGERAQAVLQDASDFARSLGSDEFGDLRGRQAPGAFRNQARDLRRRLLRKSRWPPIYVEDIRCWSVKEQALVPKKVAFLLPHELIAVLAEYGSPELMQQIDALDATNLQRHGEISAQLEAPFISLSLWGDGVPFSWDRRKSAELWSLSLPGLQNKAFRDLRLCLTALPHEWVARETQDDVMSIFAWSLAALARGSFPEARHDQQPWTGRVKKYRNLWWEFSGIKGDQSFAKEGLIQLRPRKALYSHPWGGVTSFPSCRTADDTWRKNKAGHEVPLAAVVEVKGDWKQLYQCFGVPYWKRARDKPLCWRCGATKEVLETECGPDASWLQPANRLGHFQALERMLADGGSLSPLFSFPFMDMAALRIDWLHCADQGVAAVLLGGLFHLVLADRTYGRNVEARCGQLWIEIQAFYELHQTPDRLHNLTVSMIKPKKGNVELSGSGAQIRCLVPFGRMLVNAWQEPLAPEPFAARTAMRHLDRCFFLSGDLQPQEDTLLDNALALHSCVVGLHALNAARWQIRPKLHMFLELCAEGGPPSSSWNYREESFGGSVSHQAHRRGGLASPLAMSRSVLTKFCAKEAVPRLLWYREEVLAWLQKVWKRGPCKHAECECSGMKEHVRTKPCRARVISWLLGLHLLC